MKYYRTTPCKPPEGESKTSQKSFRWRTIQDWNNLSVELRQEDNLGIFKRTLKKSIIDTRPPDRPRPVTVPD